MKKFKDDFTKVRILDEKLTNQSKVTLKQKEDIMQLSDKNRTDLKNGLEVMFPIGKPVGKPVGKTANSSVTTLDL